MDMVSQGILSSQISFPITDGTRKHKAKTNLSVTNFQVITKHFATHQFSTKLTEAFFL